LQARRTCRLDRAVSGFSIPSFQGSQIALSAFGPAKELLPGPLSSAGLATILTVAGEIAIFAVANHLQ
jgi:hypothetical protein